MKTRILLTSLLVALLLVGMLVPAAVADEGATDDVGQPRVERPVGQLDGIAPFANGAPKVVPTAPSPEDVLWDQYISFTGTNFAAQDFESAYDIYDIYAADDFENGEDWSIDTIVTRGGWTGFVDISGATAISWWIYPDCAGEPCGTPGDGGEAWTASLPPSDPQVALGVFEPEDIVLTLDTAIELGPGVWWLVHQVSLEFGLYGQWGWSGNDYFYGAILAQHNPGGGFGLPETWTPNDYGDDAMFRLEGTAGGGPQDPDIRVEPAELGAELCPDEQLTVELQVCNDGTAPLDWALTEIPEGGQIMDVLWDNGPLVTHPGGGFGGADASVLQTNLGMSTYGFGHQKFYNYRVTDEFPVDADWSVDQITFFAYQTNSPTDPSTITEVNLAVWDAPPPGGSIIWGDYGVNCMIDTGWTNIFRVTDYDMMGSARPIMASVCETPGLVLPPGEYWLDWQSDGSLSSGPWAPPISILGETTTGNAMQSLDGGATWANLEDSGSLTPQGLPFVIEGTAGGEPPDIPWLSEDPTEGTVPPGECQIVAVTFDSTGLAPGEDYYGDLLIESNDPDEPEVVVPVHLYVDPCVGGTMHVENIVAKDWQGERLIMKVLVADGDGASLSHVLVDANITTPMRDWARWRRTNLGGWARFWAPLRDAGEYEICVENLTLDGYTYEPGDNVWTCRAWPWP